MKASLILVLVAALACGGKKSPPRTDDPTAGRDAAAPAPDAAPAAALDSPEALWRAYQEAHVGATKADAEAAGRRIDALLSDEARAIIEQAADQMVTRLPTTLSIGGANLGHKILGEGAAARAPLIARATITALEPGPGGDTATLTVGDGTTSLVLHAVRAGAAWRFGPSPDLLVKEGELFTLPSGSAQTVGAASVEAAAARWVDAVNGGTGWDAFNLIAPSNRVRLRALIAQMGGAGDDDVVRILDKTLRDRRDRGITATKPTIEPGAGDRRTVVFHYSNGTEDRFEAVREDGAWWIVMPL